MIYNVHTLNWTKSTILQCTCDQQTQVSLCIDPLYKASVLHTVQSAKGLIRMCCCSRAVYPTLDSSAIESKYDQRMLLWECAVAQIDLSLRSSHKTFFTPSDCRRYIQLAKALIRLLMCSLRVCRLIRLFVQVLLYVLPCTDAQTHAQFVCANLNA